MYVAGFLSVYLLLNYRVNHYPQLTDKKWNAESISDLIFYGALGAVIGGRLGYVVFYKPAYYLAHPLEIIFVNQGGMSFHGGLLGVIVALALIAKKLDLHIFAVADFVAVVSPVGLFFGRIGNFINQELWGKPSELPWAMIFSARNCSNRH